MRVGALAGVMGLCALVASTTASEARRAHHAHHGRASGRSHAAHGGGYSPPYSAMVVDANSGRTMYAVDEDEPRHPASITKVMTLYLLFEQLERGTLSLDSELDVSSRAASQAPSKIGVRPGDTITVENAIKSIVTKSANDVAVVIAENIAGSESDFAERMTRKARQLGMTGTTYRNASGLPNPDQITTAHDLTILARAIQDKFPRYYKFFGTRSFTYAGRQIPNHNHLLGRVEGVDGIKTGFTNASGFNLMTSARLDGRHVVGVVLGGRSVASRDNIMAGLIRTNLAKAAVGRTTSLADLGETSRSRTEESLESAEADADEHPAPPRPVRVAEAIRAVEAVRPAVAAAANAAGTTTPSTFGGLKAVPPLPPSPTVLASAGADLPIRLASPPLPPSQKIEARLPSAPIATSMVVATVQPPARVVETTSSLRSVEPPEPKREAAAKPAAMTPWVIQLAAEQDEKQARAILDDARSRSGRALAKAQPFTEKVTRGGSTLYRARFSGFSEADTAQEACRSLKRTGFACFATRS